MGRLRQKAAVLVIALFSAVVLPACASSAKHTETYYTYFDTVTTVTMYGGARDFDTVCSILAPMLERYHRAADIYHEYSGEANACTLNRLAGKGPVGVSDELMELLLFGKDVFAKTNGMCNIAMGSVFSLWHDCREAALTGSTAAVPSEAALLSAAQHADIRDLILHTDERTAELTDAEMRLDLGAIAKGYAAEQIAQALEAQGFEHIALNIGGNVRTIGGKNSREDWVAGIQDPDAATDSAFLLRVSLSGEALVTSGSYQRYYDYNGTRCHHIISPVTLRPDNRFVSVTVRAGDSGLADALSTALFNMEYADGFNYVNQLDGVEACWILSNGTIKYSHGFRQFVLQ